MAEPNPHQWAQSHPYTMALSRWDNEGGAGAQRPVPGWVAPGPDRSFRPPIRVARPRPLLLQRACTPSRPPVAGALPAGA